MGSRLTIPAPRDYQLRRDVCSYGYFLLAPNRWDPRRKTFTRPLDLGGRVATVAIRQQRRGMPVVAHADRALSRGEQASARRMIRRMLNLDDDGVREFHRVDPRWKRGGRGRLFRSPTLFEDVIKTVTSCNVTWPSTMNMNRRLCEVINPAFPRPAQLARKRPQTLRSRCSVGYRDERIVELARMHERGDLDAAWFEDSGNDDTTVLNALLALPGVGPYAAANIMQLLGRYGHLPVDTETIRHGRALLGFKGTDRQVARAVEEHYAPFGEHRFRSYWFELWDFYERRRGPAWDWEADGAGRTFTAAQFARDEREAARPRARAH